MAVRHLILCLIHILYYVAIVHSILLDINDAESCDLLCKQCNVSATFANNHCECNSSNNNDKEAECVQNIQREIQAINLNTLSEDLTDEERDVRSILKSRRRLAMGDAEKVAQYFINEGPAAGHSHFIKVFNATYDSVDSATNSFSGVLEASDRLSPENEFHNEKQLNSAISWNTFDSSLYMIPETGSCAHPIMSSVVGTPIIEMINPALSYPASGLYNAISPLVGSIIHPYRHKHGLPLHHSLHRTDSLPGQILYNLFDHRRYPAYHGFLRSSNDRNLVSADQPMLIDNNDSETASKDFSNVRSNADKPIEQNDANFPRSAEPMHYSVQTPYIFSANTMHQPMQYQSFNVPYTSYYNPLINVLHPVPTNAYTIQYEYIPYGISDPLISLSNPNSYYINNANTEQKDKDLINKNVHSNNGAKHCENNISKEENKTEKDENNIS